MSYEEFNGSCYTSYVRYLGDLKRYSSHTVVAYRGDVDEFISCLRVSLLDVDREKLRFYLRDMEHKKRLCRRSLGRRVSSLRHFFGYLHGAGLMHKNPMILFKGYKQVGGLPIFLRQGQMEEVLSGLVDEGSYVSMRGKMIIELLYGLGLRISELWALEVRDISMEKGTVQVMGKGNRVRLLPFTERLLGLMRIFLDLRAEFLIGIKRQHDGKEKLFFERSWG